MEDWAGARPAPHLAPVEEGGLVWPAEVWPVAGGVHPVPAELQLLHCCPRLLPPQAAVG